MGKISIEGIEIYAFHGYYDEEQKLGSRFLINLEFELDTSIAEHSDELENTVNYQEVYNVIEEQIGIKSRLIEHVAARIADAIMDRFEPINEMKIKLSKLSPPIPGKMDNVSIELIRKRK